MIDKYRKPIIIGIVVLAVAFLISALTNSTFALFSKDIYGANTNVYSTGMLSIETNSKSENISLDNAVPMSDEDGIQTNPYIFTIKNVGNLDYFFDVKLLSTGSSDTTFSPQYIKLQIDDGDVISLSSLVNGLVKSDITLLAGESIDVSIRIWLSVDTPNSELGKSFNSKIVTDGQAVYTESNHEYTTMMDYIKYLYTSSNPTLITHNKDDGTSDKYYYSYQSTDKTWGLMNDGFKVSDTEGEGATEITNTTKLITGSEGNIRYFGPSLFVNNYIYFNCDTYPSTNCEKWRIIGIVDGKVKIIRDYIPGVLAWDQDKNQDFSLTTYSNNWETSSLQLLLNGLYYDRGDVESHTYYSGETGETATTVSLKTIGITEATRENHLISESTWYLGGADSLSSSYSNNIYVSERVGNTGDNPTMLKANVGLMYVSDYGYGTDLTKCSKTLSNYNDASNSYACMSNNWLFNGKFQWNITPDNTGNNSVFRINSNGSVDIPSVTHYAYSDAVRPTLYLDESVLKVGGDGSISNPYLINSITGISDSASDLKLGDYISYTPVVESYETDPAMTGYSDAQTIYPKELNLWRVLNKNSDGSVDIISEYVSSTDVYFYGPTGYLNYVGYLNDLAEQYEIEGITSGSRHFGYKGQTEFLNTNDVDFSSSPLFTSSTSNNSNESVGGGDILYEDDYNDVNTILGTRIAYKVGTTTATSYSIASRYYNYVSSSEFDWNIRYMSTSGYLNNDFLFSYYSTSYEFTDGHSALRPIVTLKPGLTYTGEGTSGSPWQIVS